MDQQHGSPPVRASGTTAAPGDLLLTLRRTWLDVAAQILPDDRRLVEMLADRLLLLSARGRVPTEAELLEVAEEASQHAVGSGSAEAARQLSKRLRRAIYEYLLSVDAVLAASGAAAGSAQAPGSEAAIAATMWLAYREDGRPELVWDEPALRVLKGGPPAAFAPEQHEAEPPAEPDDVEAVATEFAADDVFEDVESLDVSALEAIEDHEAAAPETIEPVEDAASTGEDPDGWPLLMVVELGHAAPADTPAPATQAPADLSPTELEALRVPEQFRRGGAAPAPQQPEPPSLGAPSYRAWADVLASGATAPVDVQRPRQATAGRERLAEYRVADAIARRTPDPVVEAIATPTADPVVEAPDLEAPADVAEIPEVVEPADGTQATADVDAVDGPVGSEAPVFAEAPFVAETPPAEETPVVTEGRLDMAEAPVVAEAPSAGEMPSAEETPVVAEARSAEEAPPAPQARSAEEAPPAPQAQSAEEEPSATETPSAAESLSAAETHLDAEAPITAAVSALQPVTTPKPPASPEAIRWAFPVAADPARATPDAWALTAGSDEEDLWRPTLQVIPAAVEPAPAPPSAPADLPPAAPEKTSADEHEHSWSVRRSPRQQVLQQRLAQRRRDEVIRAAASTFEDSPSTRPRHDQKSELDASRLPEQVEELLRRKRAGEAAALVQRAAQEIGGREIADLALDCGDRCRDRHQASAAVNSYLAAWRADPVYEVPLWRLAETCLADKETDLAVGYLERIADLMRARGDDAAAIEVYRKVIAVSPERGDVRALLQTATTLGRFPD